jgi:predicted Zn-dependent protease
MSAHKKYPGRYFDGISTRAMAVTVSLHGGDMIIEQPELWETPLRWQAKHLHYIRESANKLILKYGTLQDMQILEVEGKDFIKEFRGNFAHTLKINRQKNTALYGLFGGIAFMIALLFGAYYLLLPVLVTKMSAIFPKETETKIGREMLRVYTASEKTDPEATQLINKFYSGLKINSGYQIKITVVDSNVKNAFALPGGQIVVYSGILKSMNSYPELVALLGHETGHIAHRHSLRLMVKNVSLSALLSLIFQDYNNISGILIGKATELEQLSYGREAEEEADRFGYSVMKENKTDIKGMISLFNHLKTDDHLQNKIPEFMMTHPKLDSRIAIIEEKLKKEKNLSIKNDTLDFYWQKIRKEIKRW